jgi:hypothetical protein
MIVFKDSQLDACQTPDDSLKSRQWFSAGRPQWGFLNAVVDVWAQLENDQLCVAHGRL